MKKKSNGNGNGSNVQLAAAMRSCRQWQTRNPYTIGISQFAEHGSLDNCREGFLEGLKEAGFEEGKNLHRGTIRTAQADTGTRSDHRRQLCQ